MKNRLLTTAWLAVFLSIGCLFTLQAQNTTPTATNGCTNGETGGTFATHIMQVCSPDLAQIPAVSGTNFPGVDPADADVKLEFVLTNPQQQVPVTGADGNPTTEAAIVGALVAGTTEFDPSSLVSAGEDICVTGVVYDLRSIQRIIDAIDPDDPTGSCCSGISSFIGQDICGLLCNPDGTTPPQICMGTDITGFDQVTTLLAGLGGGAGAGAFGVDSVVLLVNSINDQIGPLAGAVDGVCPGIANEIPLCLATTNTICYTYDDPTACSAPTCPTMVTTPVSGSENGCGTVTVDLTAAAIQGSVVLDDPTNATFMWSVGGTAVADPTAASVAPNGCAATTTTFDLTIGCTEDNAVNLNGGSYTVTAYPNYVVSTSTNGCVLMASLDASGTNCAMASSNGDCTTGTDLAYDFSGDVAAGTPPGCITGDPINGSVTCPASCPPADPCPSITSTTVSASDICTGGSVTVRINFSAAADDVTVNGSETVATAGDNFIEYSFTPTAGVNPCAASASDAAYTAVCQGNPVVDNSATPGSAGQVTVYPNYVVSTSVTGCALSASLDAGGTNCAAATESGCTTGTDLTYDFSGDIAAGTPAGCITGDPVNGTVVCPGNCPPAGGGVCSTYDTPVNSDLEICTSGQFLGGASVLTCPGAALVAEVTFDDFPGEIIIGVFNDAGELVGSEGPFDTDFAGTTQPIVFFGLDPADGPFDVVFVDVFGDGMSGTDCGFNLPPGSIDIIDAVSGAILADDVLFPGDSADGDPCNDQSADGGNQIQILDLTITGDVLLPTFVDWTVNGTPDGEQDTLVCENIVRTFDFTHSGTTCQPETQEVAYTAVCNGSVVSSGNWTVTVYPDPANLSTFWSIADGACTGPVVNIDPGCETFITITQNGGPTFPANPGDAGTVNYDVTYGNLGPCCVDILEEGTAIAGGNIVDAGGTCAPGAAPATDNFPVTYTGATTTIAATGTGSIVEFCITFTPSRITNDMAISILNTAQDNGATLYTGTVYTGGTDGDGTGDETTICFDAAGLSGILAGEDINDLFFLVQDAGCAFGDGPDGVFSSSIIINEGVIGNVCETTGMGNYDCPATCDAAGNGPGDPCDDGDACTTGETYDVNCNCTGGTPVDADNDNVPCATDCDDNDPTIGAPGSACDDGDPNTMNDVLDANCVCMGNTVQPNNPAINAISTCFDAAGVETNNAEFYVEVTVTDAGSGNTTITATNGVTTLGPVAITGSAVVGPFNFADGDVMVTITDSNGNTGTAIVAARDCSLACGSSGLVELTQGSSNGGISPFTYNTSTATVEGTGPYSYDFDRTGFVRYFIRPSADGTSVTLNFVYNDEATFTVTVTDANGCQVIITNNAGTQQLTIADYTITPATNAFTANGALDITATGGPTGNYLFNWIGPRGFTATTEDIENIGYGWYTVNVCDDANNNSACDNGEETEVAFYYVSYGVQPINGGFIRGKAALDNGAASWLNAYPNPLNTVATVEFGVQEAGQVNVAVYNVAGTQVANLFNNYAEAGEVYTVPFNAEDLAAGVYIVQFTTATGETQHQKLIIAK